MTIKWTGSTLLYCLVTAALALPGELRAQAEEDAGQRGQAAQLTLKDLRTFTDVFNQARRNYVEDVTDKELLDAAIRGMLMELDPHSAYLSQPDYKDLDDTSRGRYSGIGVNVEAEDYRIVVKAILNDSPADQAGINPGDVIVSIDGKPVKGRYLPDAIAELDGEPGTRVALEIAPPGGDSRELTLQREYLLIPTFSFEMLDQSYGYFKLTGFHRDSATHFEQTLESIHAEGGELRGVVIDLRDNPGGVLQPAVAIADGFLDEGLIVSTRGRNASMQMEFRAQPGQWLPGVPVVLLVDRGTASASEVLAGALQDHGRALIVGEQTFGKGSVQSVLPLRNGAGIKLTTARYYTPSGRSIQASGIVPDIVIDEGSYADESDLRIREADLDRHLGPDQLMTGHGAPTARSQEFPLDEVLEVLDKAGLLSGAERPISVEEEPGS